MPIFPVRITHLVYCEGRDHSEVHCALQDNMDDIWTSEPAFDILNEVSEKDDVLVDLDWTPYRSRRNLRTKTLREILK